MTFVLSPLLFYHTCTYLNISILPKVNITGFIIELYLYIMTFKPEGMIVFDKEKTVFSYHSF